MLRLSRWRLGGRTTERNGEPRLGSFICQGFSECTRVWEVVWKVEIACMDILLTWQWKPQMRMMTRRVVVVARCLYPLIIGMNFMAIWELACPPLHVVSTYEAGLWAWRQVCAAAALPPFGTASRWHSQSPASTTAWASQQSCHLESGCTRGSTASCSKAADGAWPGAEDEMLGCLLGEGAARPACLHVFLFSIPPVVRQFGSTHRELCRWRAPACWGHPQCKPCAP